MRRGRQCRERRQEAGPIPNSGGLGRPCRELQRVAGEAVSLRFATHPSGRKERLASVDRRSPAGRGSRLRISIAGNFLQFGVWLGCHFLRAGLFAGSAFAALCPQAECLPLFGRE